MRYYHIDSFSKEVFKGNPAGVCILENDWLSDQCLQNIAAENCLSETAFILKKDGQYHIRWFAPLAEVYLCGHATLAAAYAVFHFENHDSDLIIFQSNRGPLPVTRNGELLTLDFPIGTINPIHHAPAFDSCFNLPPKEVYSANADLLFVYDNEQEIRNIEFNLEKIAKISAEGIIITAAGKDCDFVSRCFAPQVGINEDPVTGSAHTVLAPYWHKKTGKSSFHAKQLSPRSGELHCVIEDDRVLISGYATLYMKGNLFLS